MVYGDHLDRLDGLHRRPPDPADSRDRRQRGRGRRLGGPGRRRLLHARGGLPTRGRRLAATAPGRATTWSRASRPRSRSRRAARRRSSGIPKTAAIRRSRRRRRPPARRGPRRSRSPPTRRSWPCRSRSTRAARRRRHTAASTARTRTTTSAPQSFRPAAPAGTQTGISQRAVLGRAGSGGLRSRGQRGGQGRAHLGRRRRRARRGRGRRCVPAGGAWSAPHPLATAPSGDFMESPQVVVGADGTVTADWAVHDGNGSGAVWTARESPAGAWNTPVTISQPFKSDAGGATVIDPAGDVDVLANLFNGSGFPVWSIVEDAGGPALDGLKVPARGTVGATVNFAVTPLDAWSAISATHWNFGDGTTATDELVSHVYTKPGTYTVGTSSSDILGNTTSQSSKIVIAAAPGDGTGPTPPTKPLTLRVTEAHRRWREAKLIRRAPPPPRRHALRLDREPSRSGHIDVRPGGPRAAPPWSLPGAERPRPAQPGLCAHGRARQAFGAHCRGRPAHGQVQGAARRSPPANRPLHGHRSRGCLRPLGHPPAAFHDHGLTRGTRLGSPSHCALPACSQSAERI